MKRTIIFLLITAFIITSAGCAVTPEALKDEQPEEYELDGSIVFYNTSDFYRLVEEGNFDLVDPEALIKIEDIVDQEIIDFWGVQVYVDGKNDYHYLFYDFCTIAFYIDYDPSASINDRLDDPDKYTEMDDKPGSEGNERYGHKYVYHLDDIDLYYSAAYAGSWHMGTHLYMYMDGFTISLVLLTGYGDKNGNNIPDEHLDWLRAYFDKERATEEINHVKDVVLNREHRPVEPDTSSGAGCGGFSVFAGFIALVCAAGAIVLIKKK